MWNKRIIGLDFDDKKTGLRIIKLIEILGIKAEYRLSSSRRGYHVRIHTKKNCDKENNLKIRYMFGDCYGRFIGDVRRLQHGLIEFDILFEHKNNKKTTKWRKIK